MNDGIESPRSLIESIRRLEFGIGAELDGEAKVVVENILRKYQSLLATVAEDLNSKQSHFILELVQNADDNDYPGGASPRLSFTLDASGLIIENNEIGFSPENVKSLCSAGESSKKAKKGYIGEKGIGFKSVFKVTDAPEIHSNGFHFKFDRTNEVDLLGYVVPHWHEPQFPVDDQVTTVFLPHRDGEPIDAALLSDLDATLLLFLEDLRELRIATDSYCVRHHRVDSGGITTLTTEIDSSPPFEGSKSYLRSVTAVDVSAIREPKREGITESDVVLAFPLSAAGEAAPIPTCPTYAFLPIREFGFSFCIQADFILVSSREGLHEDLAWNLKLRDSIAPTFALALEKFKATPSLAKTYLRFLPEAGDVADPFFRPVVQQIVDCLKVEPCVPVTSGAWRKPSEVILAPPVLQELFSPSDVKQLFGSEYPDPEFVAPEGSLKRLGCRDLLISEVLEVFSKHSKWLSTKDLEWKARFYAYLATSTHSAAYRKGMLAIPSVPTGDRMVVPQSETTFYPLSAETTYGFEHELSLLDKDLLSLAVAMAPEVEGLFNSLNVKHANPLELVRSHILKRHTDEALPNADQGALIGHVRYIRDKLDEYLALSAPSTSQADALKALREGLFLGSKRTENGTWYFSRPPDLYLSTQYQPQFDIEQLLGDKLKSDLLLSDRYIQKRKGNRNKSKTDADLDGWRRFFQRIGVNDSPRLENLGANAEFSEELIALVESPEMSTRRATLECLDNAWTRYEPHLTMVTSTRGGYITQPTLFARQLKAIQAPVGRRQVSPLDQCYLDCKEIRDLFGKQPTFVDAKIGNIGFLNASGVTHSVDASACLKRLRQVRGGGGEATRSQVRAIYRRLEILWSSEKALIDNAFKTEPLVLVRAQEEDLWLLPKDACWKATGLKFLDARNPPLSGQYVDHSHFFTKLIAVPATLSPDKWVDGLGQVTAIEDPSERAEVATAIYRHLSRELGAASSNTPPWLARMQVHPFFLNHRGRLVSKSNSLFADDSPEFSKLFFDQPGISILVVPKEQLSAVGNLLRRVGVQGVSTAMTVEVAPGVKGATNADLTHRLAQSFESICRIVYDQSHERFEVAVKDGLFERLRRLRVVEVPDLKLDVSLLDAVRQTQGDIALRGDELVLRSGAPSHLHQVAMEVRKLLKLPPHLSDTISLVLLSPSTDDAKGFLQVRGISALPEEEQAALSAAHKDLVTEKDQKEDFPETVEAKARAPRSEPASPPTQTRASDAEVAPSDSQSSGIQSTKSRGATRDPGQAGHDAIASKTSTSPGLASPSPRTADQPSSSETAPPSAPDGALVTRPGKQSTSRSIRGNGSGRKRRFRTKHGRLLSYAEPGLGKVDAEEDPNCEVAKRKKAVERAAVDFFKESLSDRWAHLEEMPHENEGFDFQAVAHDETAEFVEVKGQSGPWTEEGVTLTRGELLAAAKHRNSFWLCVVEFATDPNRRKLWLIRDPFGSITQFRLDVGWKNLASAFVSRPQHPEPGMFVQIEKEGRAKVVRVKGTKTFAKLHLEFEDGRQVFSRLFNPANMTLSYE